MRTARVLYDTPETLRAWRDQLGITTEQAAKRLKISQGFYSHLEHGTRRASGAMAKRIHDVTQVPIAVLVGAA